MEGLGEKLHGAGFHGPYGHPDVAIAGDADNRDGDLSSGQFVLQVEPAQFGQVHVEHQAAGCVRPLTGQKLPGGAEGLDAGLYRPDEAREGFTTEAMADE